MRLNGSRVDKPLDDSLGLLIKSASFESSLDEGGGLAPIERKKLGSVTFNLLLGDL